MIDPLRGNLVFMPSFSGNDIMPSVHLQSPDDRAVAHTIPS